MGIGIYEIAIISALFAFWIGGNIARNAGFSRWYGLLLIVPIVNVVIIWVFAFTDWPAAQGKS